MAWIRLRDRLLPDTQSLYQMHANSNPTVSATCAWPFQGRATSRSRPALRASGRSRQFGAWGTPTACGNGWPLREPNLCEYAHVNSAPSRKIWAE
jgi:hypothetical protein